MSFLKPVCANCGVQMRCMKNGHTIRQLSSHKATMFVWQGDRYACPDCNASVVVGIGQRTEIPVHPHQYEEMPKETTDLVFKRLQDLR